MTCVITGCALDDPAERRIVWGDLHRIGDAWVFNAVCFDGEARWQTDEDYIAPDHMKRLVILAGCPSDVILERRGVIVIDSKWAILNPAARDYIKS